MTQPTLTDQLNSFRYAHDLGIAYASQLQAGDVFHGAGIAAQTQGFSRDTPEYRLFVGAALDVFERKSIYIDRNGRITEVAH